MKSELNVKPGFYLGKEAFGIVRDEVLPDMPGDIKQFGHNGLLFILADDLGPYNVLGIGEPYATLANKLDEFYGVK